MLLYRLKLMLMCVAWFFIGSFIGSFVVALTLISLLFSSSPGSIAASYLSHGGVITGISNAAGLICGFAAAWRYLKG